MAFSSAGDLRMRTGALLGLWQPTLTGTFLSYAYIIVPLARVRARTGAKLPLVQLERRQRELDQQRDQPPKREPP